MKQLIRKGSVLILLGPGGVGKTTIGAALAVAAAQSGLDTGVITVDPARRLRDALGLERLTAEPMPLERRRLRAAGLDPSLRLAAMVLDVKRAWDGLVERCVRSPDSRRVILENSFYRSLSGKFAGSESYAALEQLYDLHASHRFEAEIVDTPPAAHAFEFIQAPADLVRLLDSRAARWLFTPYSDANKGVLGLAGRAARFVVGQLEQFAGVRTLSAISEFFASAAGAAGSISERFRKVEALLHSPAVQFVLVTTTEAGRLREAHALVDRMESERLRLGAIVLNRFLDLHTFAALGDSPRREPAALARIARMRPLIAAEIARDSRLDAIVRFLEDYRAQQRAEAGRVMRFAAELPAGIEIAVAPEIDTGVRDLATLARIAAILAGGGGRKFIGNAAAAFGVTTGRRMPRQRRAIQQRAAR